MFSNTTKSKPNYPRVPPRKPPPSGTGESLKVTQPVSRAEKPLTRSNFRRPDSIYRSSDHMEANAMAHMQDPAKMEAGRNRWNYVISGSPDPTRTFDSFVEKYKQSSHRPAQLNCSTNPPPKSPSRKAWHQVKNSVSNYAKSPFHRTKEEPNRKAMAPKTDNYYVPQSQHTIPLAPAKQRVQVPSHPQPGIFREDFVGYCSQKHTDRVTVAANASSVSSRHPALTVNRDESSRPALTFPKQHAAGPYQAVTAPGPSNQQIHRQGTPYPNKYRPSPSNTDKPLPPPPTAHNHRPMNRVPNFPSNAAHAVEQPRQKISTVRTHHYDRVDPLFRPLSTHPSISDIGHTDNLSRHGTRRGGGRNSPVSPLTDSGSDGSGVDIYMRGRRPIDHVSNKSSTAKKYGGNYGYQDEATRVWRRYGEMGLDAQGKGKGKGRSMR